MPQDMEEYQKTGHHPAVERAKRDRDAIRLLPDPKPSRRHVFMDIDVQGRAIGGQGVVDDVAGDGGAWPPSLVSVPTPLGVHPNIALLSISQGRLSPSAGRLVIELYDDLAPVPVGAFQNRCQPDASETFKGTIIHKLVAEQAAWGGRSKAYVSGQTAGEEGLSWAGVHAWQLVTHVSWHGVLESSSILPS